MRSITVTQPGGPEVLQVVERPIPEPRGFQVLIRVKAAGVNRADLLMRQGKYGSAAPIDVLGLEASGLIEACGNEVERWKPGDGVCALLPNGGYAEYVLADARLCLPMPEILSFEEAAGLPETVLTVWSNVFQRMHVQPGETLLIQGGTSGIGLTAIQLARLWGIRAFATAGTDEKCRFAELWGAEQCINYKTQDFETELKPIGMDAILDYIGGDYTAKHIRLLKPEGRLCWLASLKGTKSEINIMEIMSKRLVLTGSMLSPRDVLFKAQLTADVETNVWPLIASGQLKTHIYQTFPLEKATEAHQLMEKGEHIGKIILTV
ncbi:MAG: NAD(P)H-quinone oxidoreductase [Siphonobacter sp.]